MFIISLTICYDINRIKLQGGMPLSYCVFLADVFFFMKSVAPVLREPLIHRSHSSGLICLPFTRRRLMLVSIIHVALLIFYSITDHLVCSDKTHSSRGGATSPNGGMQTSPPSSGCGAMHKGSLQKAVFNDVSPLRLSPGVDSDSGSSDSEPRHMDNGSLSDHELSPSLVTSTIVDSAKLSAADVIIQNNKVSLMCTIWWIMLAARLFKQGMSNNACLDILPGPNV